MAEGESVNFDVETHIEGPCAHTSANIRSRHRSGQPGIIPLSEVLFSHRRVIKR